MIRRKRTPLKIIGNQKITLNGQCISYIIKRSNRARYVRIEIKSDAADLTAVIPKFYNAASLPNLLESKQKWILTKLAEHKSKKPLPVRNEPTLNDSIPFLGKNLEIVSRDYNGVDKDIKIELNKLVINSRYKDGKLNALIECWYRMQAQRIIGDKAYYLSNELGLTYNRLIVRGQKTLWASCSRKGTLSFNWKLMMLPEPVIDYVVIHELMHLKEMNHSKRFWKLVSDKCPDWKTYRKSLKTYSNILSLQLS